MLSDGEGEFVSNDAAQDEGPKMVQGSDSDSDFGQPKAKSTAVYVSLHLVCLKIVCFIPQMRVICLHVSL